MLAGQNGARGRICTRTGDVLDVVPLRWATRANGMEPPAGDAPAGILYKRNPQAAAWRREWSQSPVLPWTQRAYETCLSAGSTAMLSKNQQNGAPTRNCTGLTCLPSRRIAQNALGALKMVGAKSAALFASRMSNERSADELRPRKWSG